MAARTVAEAALVASPNSWVDGPEVSPAASTIAVSVCFTALLLLFRDVGAEQAFFSGVVRKHSGYCTSRSREP